MSSAPHLLGGWDTMGHTDYAAAALQRRLVGQRTRRDDDGCSWFSPVMIVAHVRRILHPQSARLKRPDIRAFPPSPTVSVCRPIQGTCPVTGIQRRFRVSFIRQARKTLQMWTLPTHVEQGRPQVAHSHLATSCHHVSTFAAHKVCLCVLRPRSSFSKNRPITDALHGHLAHPTREVSRPTSPRRVLLSLGTGRRLIQARVIKVEP